MRSSDRANSPAMSTSLISAARDGNATIAARIASQKTISLPAPAPAPGEMGLDPERRLRVRAGHRPSPRANRPCGRTISVTTMTP